MLSMHGAISEWPRRWRLDSMCHAQKVDKRRLFWPWQRSVCVLPIKDEQLQSQWTNNNSFQIQTPIKCRPHLAPKKSVNSNSYRKEYRFIATLNTPPETAMKKEWRDSGVWLYFVCLMWWRKCSVTCSQLVSEDRYIVIALPNIKCSKQ
jgi:hypothetical protein